MFTTQILQLNSLALPWDAYNTSLAAQFFGPPLMLFFSSEHDDRTQIASANLRLQGSKGVLCRGISDGYPSDPSQPLAIPTWPSHGYGLVIAMVDGYPLDPSKPLGVYRRDVSRGMDRALLPAECAQEFDWLFF